MRTLRFEGSSDSRDHLIVLPPINAGADDVAAAGFVAAVAGRVPLAHLTLVDLPVRALDDRSDLAVLREAVLLPALASGRRVWLTGISLGGWLALQLARQPGSTIAGVGLIAPWLGTRTLPSDEEHATWAYLASSDRAPVWLGFGAEDRFADFHRRAAALLPADAVTEIPGAHDWQCWRSIWEHFLAWVPR